MSQRWFYTCGGLIFGPVSTAELQETAAKGFLSPSDTVWPEEGGRPLAAPLEAAVNNFPELPTVAPAPDWLEDVNKEPPTPPAAVPAPTALPDWIEGLRRAEEAGPGPARRTAPRPAAPSPPGPLPDWLADMPGNPAVVPAAAEAEEPAAEAEQPAPESRAAEGPRPLQEIFESACVALRRWVDAPGNRPLIVAGDLDAIDRVPILRQFFAGVQRYGPDMSDRLRKHLAFLVDNRRKFFTAGKR
jgi:hypothetical protein